MPVTINEDAADPPKSINHYTDLSGFIGIVGNGQLWASNVAFLNDREELEHGIKCAERALVGLLRDRKLSGWKDHIEHAVKALKAGEMPNTYATCFCSKSDLLSQWRGYGGMKQGIGLTFDLAGLEDMLPSDKSFITPVSYGVVAGKQGIVEKLKAHLGGVDTDLFDYLLEDAKSKEVHSALSKLIPSFKHIGFKPEMEWRLVVQQDTLRDHVKYRASGNVIVPYLTIDGLGGRLPLKVVKIGPGSDMNLTARSVRQFLDAKGYNGVKVELSRVPFRT